jgi:monofunctional biosynthetic peptidoglycan transglycosylase
MYRVYQKKKQNHPIRKLLFWLVIIALLPFATAALYVIFPPPLTPLMVQRVFEGEPLHKSWVPLSKISPGVVYSAVASEDNAFCIHNGFDWKALEKAYDTWQAAQAMDDDEARIKGGSTISQQTAKNLFLLPVQSPIRKALEFPLTMALEKLMSKKRIIELYLNIAEWGHGIYGVQAASQYYFHTDANKLTWRQGAQLAAILPSPRKWPITGSYAQTRAGHIQGRVSQLGSLLDCVRTRGAYPPLASRATITECPNCQKSKQPAGASSPPSVVPDLPPLPSATQISASAYPSALPSESPTPSSQNWNDVPNTSSPDLVPMTPSCSTSGCPEASPSPSPAQSQVQSAPSPAPAAETPVTENTTTSSSPQTTQP